MLAFIVIGAKEKIKIHDSRPMFFSCSQDDSGLTHNNFGQQETTKTAKKATLAISLHHRSREMFFRKISVRAIAAAMGRRRSRELEKAKYNAHEDKVADIFVVYHSLKSFVFCPLSVLCSPFSRLVSVA